MSYVLTASAVFSAALEKIVAGLNRAGFSRNDFRTPDAIEPARNQLTSNHPQPASTAFALSSTGDLLSAANQQTQAPVNPVHNGPISEPEATTTSTPDIGGDYSVDATIQCGEYANSQLDAEATKIDGQYIAPEQRER